MHNLQVVRCYESNLQILTGIRRQTLYRAVWLRRGKQLLNYYIILLIAVDEINR